ncbi:MAG: radical SAM protein [Proteobacteria bacterium]|nr:radical SAM protein [Pseudomonadota bacterium]MBU1738359.1 radical SAM protein [Pseudomonadota bacterium]
MFDPDFDRQKLMFHPAPVAHWLAAGKTAGPLYTELELSNRCNCRCLFCGVDHQVNKTGAMMRLPLAEKIIGGLAECGNKSLMLCGNGEPLLNPDVLEIVRFAAGRMSVSITTNGSPLNASKLPLIDSLEWIRFSINGCNPNNYGEIHGTNPEVFTRVIENLVAAVERKKRMKLPVTIGTQLVLLPENAALVKDFAENLKEIGVDYFSVKPYSQHPLSENRLAIDYRDYLDLREEVLSLERDSFKVIFRTASMLKAGGAKTYGQCFGTHFISFISANGDVWECNVFVGDPRFFIGNGGDESIRSIWEGERRQKVVEFVENELDLGLCRDLCRMDECNRFLWRLKNPLPHDNFI